MLKRLFSIITISLILTGSFFNAYSSINHVYADDDTDSWMQVTTNEQLVEAFRYYCKSRDLTIEGSVADAVTSFTTKTFNGLCNTLGIDMTALQAQIKYQTDGNLGTRFLFNTLSIDAYNRIFAQFLQDNELQVGDSVDNLQLYSGKYFIDNDGNGCLVYRINASGEVGRASNNINLIMQYGTPLKYSQSDLVSMYQNGLRSFTINVNSTKGSTYTLNLVSFTGNGNNALCIDNTSFRFYAYPNDDNNKILDGCPIVALLNNGKLYIGCYARYTLNGNYYRNGFQTGFLYEITSSENVQDANIYITTNNTTINNNIYEGDTIINNNGTTGDDDTPDNPDIPDPNPGPSPDPPTIPDSGGWQDFSLPEMPNDWLIYGMEKKFPFDIPFNILFALSLLNHEPEIPKFEGDIDLQVCTWHYDIDLTPFDDIATILRKFEVLGFIIGLAILTKNLINWG